MRGWQFAVLALLAPGVVTAQGSPLVRVTGTMDSYLTEAHDNLEPGYSFGADVLFGGRTKIGLGLSYGDYVIAGQPESLVQGGLDIILLQDAGDVYFEGRLGYEAQAFDVIDTRYAYEGVHAGGALGWLQSMGPVLADVGVSLGYYSSFAAWANDNELDDTLTGARLGLRLGMAFTPGGR